jgi:hypothetical protein
MKLRLSWLALVCLTLAAVPGAAGDLYDNGPINGQVDAWTIDFGFVVSDTFTLSRSSEVTGLSFGAWLIPGDTLDSVEVSFTSGEFGGTTFFDQQVNLTAGGCFVNQYGYNVCTETGNFNANMNAGTYWMNLSNAIVSNGDPVYWDENAGVDCGGSDGNQHNCPSMPSQNSLGTILSEAFTLNGSNSGTGTTPEPTSLLLFASGVVAVAGVVRRKLQ